VTRQFDGKVIVVTGAARGIGKAIAARFISEGGHVVVADIDLDEAEPTANELGALASAVRLDVTDSRAVGDLVADTVARHERLDVWVNNAGVTDNTPTELLTDEGWRRMLAVDLDGTFYGAREAGKHFLNAGGGVIVNIASISGYRATALERHVAYDVAKAGVVHMTRVLGAEWADRNIRVNAVAPGYTDTEILNQVGAKNPEIMERWLRRIPAGRFVQPEEIANLVVFLASDQASAVTGHVLVADGAYTAL
jgi:NAD(P)-dependent dehydrogenase (short-subunit alcohol dehydrogenase family)